MGRRLGAPGRRLIPWINIPFVVQNDITNYWHEEDEQYSCNCIAQLPKFLLCMYHSGMYNLMIGLPNHGRYILCDFPGESPIYHDPNDDSWYRNTQNE